MQGLTRRFPKAADAHVDTDVDTDVDTNAASLQTSRHALIGRLFMQLQLQSRMFFSKDLILWIGLCSFALYVTGKRARGKFASYG